MRNVLVLQHVAHEPLGTLNPLLKDKGLRIRYVNFQREPNAEPSLDGYNGIVILGGPMGVYEADKFPHLNHEFKLVEQALKKNIPVLGICLGAQIIAKVLGAHVREHTQKEMGWHTVELTPQGQSDSLFQHFEKNEKIFQMHGDTFDIPTTSEHLARSELCEGQAFRYSEKVYGFQFHLEVDRAMIERWLKIPEHLKYLKDTGLTAEQILKDTDLHIARSLNQSRETFLNFINLFGLKDRPIILGSDHGGAKKKPGDL